MNFSVTIKSLYQTLLKAINKNKIDSHNYVPKGAANDDNF